MTSRSRASLSVIVIPLLGGAQLRACLDALPGSGTEVIVVCSDTRQAEAARHAEYRSVRVIDGSGLTVPQRRALGVSAAAGEIVALIEDTSLPDPAWCNAVLDAFASPATGAAGGPTPISPDLPPRYEALAWSEYGRFHETRAHRLALSPAGAKAGEPFPIGRLPGNNMACLRDKALALSERQEGSLYEFEISADMQDQGLDILFVPSMRVTYTALDTRNASLASRLNHGRLFASARTDGRGMGQRLVWAAKSCLLPLILSARTLANMTAPGATLPRQLTIAGWVVAMETAWALGEFLGYVLGRGTSHERWR